MLKRWAVLTYIFIWTYSFASIFIHLLYYSFTLLYYSFTLLFIHAVTHTVVFIATSASYACQLRLHATINPSIQLFNTPLSSPLAFVSFIYTFILQTTFQRSCKLIDLRLFLALSHSKHPTHWPSVLANRLYKLIKHCIFSYQSS